MSKPRIIFAGTPDFAAHSLAALLAAQCDIVAVYTQPDRPAGRGGKLRASPVKLLAQQYNLPVHQPKTLRDIDAQQALRELNPDVMIVAAYGLILPEAVLSIPTQGCINIHASLLPRWRGAAPIQRAILAGDTKTGITIMQMDVGLDTGAMLHRVSCPIEPDETARSLHDKLQQLGADAIVTVMQDLARYQANGEAQDDTFATYADKISKAEAEINWASSAPHVVRHIHAFNPAPGAYTWLQGERVKLFAAKVSVLTSDESPGAIVAADTDTITIATAVGCVDIMELQLPGSRQMSAQEILNSRFEQFAPGGHFGS